MNLSIDLVYLAIDLVKKLVYHLSPSPLVLYSLSLGPWVPKIPKGWTLDLLRV